jgi:hypothetical protein
MDKIFDYFTALPICRADLSTAKIYNMSARLRRISRTRSLALSVILASIKIARMYPSIRPSVSEFTRRSGNALSSVDEEFFALTWAISLRSYFSSFRQNRLSGPVNIEISSLRRITPRKPIMSFIWRQNFRAWICWKFNSPKVRDSKRRTCLLHRDEHYSLLRSANDLDDFWNILYMQCKRDYAGRGSQVFRPFTSTYSFEISSDTYCRQRC